jgi:hypothetical protein
MRTPAAVAQWPGVHLEGRVSLALCGSLTREVLMPAGLLVLQLFLCSISTSISDVRTMLPANIVVQAELRAAVLRLWEGSPTFRAQCLKIGQQKRYRVAVVADPGLTLNRNWRAQCVLRVYTSGFVSARVMVPPGRDLDELIPHELEHVIEHIEGIDVKREAAKHRAAVYDTGNGQIETLRALKVGRQVRQELEASREAVTTLTRR